MYCVPLSVAISCPVTDTVAPPGPFSRPDSFDTLGAPARMVTSDPGRHELRVFPGARYSLARAKLCAGLALASRKPFTICSGLQSGSGPRTIRPQQPPLPAPNAGRTGADTGWPLVGSAVQPPAATTATTSAAASPIGPQRRSFIGILHRWGHRIDAIHAA